MQKLLITFLLAMFFVQLHAQAVDRFSLSFFQFKNNYRYNEMLNTSILENEFVIDRFVDHIGISYGRTFGKNAFFEAHSNFNITNGFSKKYGISSPDQADPSFAFQSFSAMLMLEYGKYWKIPNHQDLGIGISSIIAPRISSANYQSRVNHAFPFHYNAIEVSAFIVPQLSYDIDGIFIVNLKMPVEFLSLYRIRSYHENPNLTGEERWITHNMLQALLLNRTFAFTVGYQFNGTPNSKN